MKIAFVCDWLTGMRGGERCLEAMCEVFSQADIYTLVYYPENFNGEFDSHKVSTSFIQKLPGNDKNFRRYLPLFPKAIERFDFSGYDFVLSFSHCVAKSIIVPKEIPHVCYCHSPVRYAWDMRDDYISSLPRSKRLLANITLDWLKKWDLKTSTRPDHYIANSKFIRDRIMRNYGLDSKVVYPPVDCERFAVSKSNDDYYLVLSALVPYKRIDIAVEAFSGIDKKLVVVGKGSELEKLKEMATVNVEFVSDASDEEVNTILSNAKALLFPGVEDFGIVPVEAQACGKPVIAFGDGGALETVVGVEQGVSEESTGIFFYEQTAQALLKAVNELEANYDKFSPETCRLNAESFNRARYKAEMISFVNYVISNNHK